MEEFDNSNDVGYIREEDKKKIMDVIKEKIDNATNEELQEALEFIEKQLKQGKKR